VQITLNNLFTIDKPINSMACSVMNYCITVKILSILNINSLINIFFQWMYILPLVIFMMIAGASNPEARQ